MNKSQQNAVLAKIGKIAKQNQYDSRDEKITPISQGQKAAQKGDAKSTNPYRNGTISFEMWNRGYDYEVRKGHVSGVRDAWEVLGDLMRKLGLRDNATADDINSQGKAAWELYKRPGTAGEKEAAFAALKRMLPRLEDRDLREKVLTEFGRRILSFRNKAK